MKVTIEIPKGKYCRDCKLLCWCYDPENDSEYFYCNFYEEELEFEMSKSIYEPIKCRWCKDES